MRSFALTLLVAACLHAPASLNDEADAAMQSLAGQGFAGSVLVSCGDEVLFAGNYGLDAAEQREPSYWVASISKQFTAAAILLLARENRLSLNDQISRFFPDAPADKATISVRQLLTHQSGLTQIYAADGVTDRAIAARAILAARVASPPGAEFHYSNDNYTLLAIIIEMVSGESFEDYVRHRVFAPAGLRHAGFWPEVDEEYAPPTLVTLAGPAGRANWGFRGGTGMRASVPDLYRWMRALQPGHMFAASELALLFGPHATTSQGEGVGFGWYSSVIEGVQWRWTRGSDSSGYNAIVYSRVDTPLLIIAATHAGPAEATGPGWSRHARDTLMAIYGDRSCTP